MQIAIMGSKLLQAWYVLAFVLNVASGTCEANRDDLSLSPSVLGQLNELLTRGLEVLFLFLRDHCLSTSSFYILF